MGRRAKPPAERRGEILEAARRLTEARGYEQVTIQDILDELEISKGAFYHYFESKHHLLEALVDGMGDEMEALAAPVVADPLPGAIDKLRRLFGTLGRWKTGQKAFVLALLRVWYADENALLREKTRAMIRRRLGPLLETIVRQGRAEGAFTSSDPQHAGKVVLSLMQGLNDEFGVLLLSIEGGTVDSGAVEGVVAAYTEALHRVLGMPEGTVEYVEHETLEEWLALVGAGRSRAR